MASSMLPVVSEKGVTVRLYRDEDYDEMLPIWQRGFLEMWPHTWTLIGTQYNVRVAAVGLAIVALLYSWLGLVKLALAAFAWLLVLVTPLGLWVGGKLFWLSILVQSRISMSNIKRDWMKPGLSCYWIAEHDGKVVGCIGVKAGHTLQAERLSLSPEAVARQAEFNRYEASVWRLSVHENARRLGIGHLLMKQAERWALEQGRPHVSFITGNVESQRFYVRIGYQVESVERARLALFGLEAPPHWSTSIRAWFKERALQMRLNVRKSIMVKHLDGGTDQSTSSSS